MIVTLRANWDVRAGLIPGVAMQEYSRGWRYTSQDYEDDGNERGENYNSMAKAAHDYAASLEAGGLNWVKVEYIWL